MAFTAHDLAGGMTVKASATREGCNVNLPWGKDTLAFSSPEFAR